MNPETNNPKNILDPRVYAGTKELVDFSNSLAKYFPYYGLDFTWPSLGLLGLYGGSLINKRAGILLSGTKKGELSKPDAHLLLTVSCYMATFAANCWRAMDPTLKVNVLCNQENGVSDIILKADSGIIIQGNLKVNISAALREIILEPSPLVDYFEKTALEVPPQNNIFKTISYGLCSGLSSIIEGEFAENSVFKAEEQIYILNDFLSKSSFSNLKENFPSESKSLKDDIFKGGAILLPPGFNETSIYARAIKSICDYLDEKAFSKKKSIDIALSLSKLADVELAAPGFIIAAGLYKHMSDEKREELFLISDRFKNIVSNFSKTLFHTRLRMSGEENWYKFIEYELFEAAEEAIKIEKKLGLLPLLRLKNKTLQDKAYLKLLKFIEHNEGEELLEEIDLLIEKKKASLEIILLKAFTHLWLMEIDEASNIIKNLKIEDFNNNDFLLSNYYEIKAKLTPLKKSSKQKKDFFNLAIKHAESSRDRSDTANLYLELFTIERQERNLEKSWKLIDEALSFNPDNFYARSRRVLVSLERAASKKSNLELDEKELFYLYNTSPAHPLSFTIANFYSYIQSVIESDENSND